MSERISGYQQQSYTSSFSLTVMAGMLYFSASSANHDSPGECYSIFRQVKLFISVYDTSVLSLNTLTLKCSLKHWCGEVEEPHPGIIGCHQETRSIRGPVHMGTRLIQLMIHITETATFISLSSQSPRFSTGWKLYTNQNAKNFFFIKKEEFLGVCSN